MPEGSNLLKVVNFSFSPTGICFEVGSDITRFKERDPGYQQFLGNGFLSISAATTLSSNPDDWMVSPPMPFTIRDGKAVIDMQGDTAVGTAMPPSAFFKAIITPFYGSSTPPEPVIQPFEP